MDDHLTDEQLREMATPGMPPIGAGMAVELLSLRARVAKLEAVLKECADDLEAEFRHKYRLSDGTIHPAQQRDFDRDMDLVVRARAALSEAA